MADDPKSSRRYRSPHPPPKNNEPPDRSKGRGRKNEGAGPRFSSKYTKPSLEGLARIAPVTAAPGEIDYRIWEPVAKVAAFEGLNIGDLRRGGLPIVGGMVLEADWQFWRAERGETREAYLAHARDEGA